MTFATFISRGVEIVVKLYVRQSSVSAGKLMELKLSKMCVKLKKTGVKMICANYTSRYQIKIVFKFYRERYGDKADGSDEKMNQPFTKLVIRIRGGNIR